MLKSKIIPLPETDVLIIGGGIMGATLASILKEVDSNLRVDIVEALTKPALESSHPLNNAGTGHAGCRRTAPGPAAAPPSATRRRR